MGTSAGTSTSASTMAALRKRSHGVRDFGLDRVPVPVPGPGQVLVRSEAVGLCGSDVHAVRSDVGYEWLPTPVTLGHEVCGTVVAAADARGEKLVGARVVVIAIDGCGRCADCRDGRGNYCADRTCFGLHGDGGLASFFVVDASRLWVVDELLDPELAVLIEPAAIVFQALRALGPDLGGRRVGVSGPGAIGLLSGLECLRRGADVVMYGPETGAEVRLDFARTLGLRVGDPSGPREPADHWVEASGAGGALAGAIAALGMRGKIVVPAMYGRLPEVDLNQVVRKGLSIHGSYGYTREDYAAATALVTQCRASLAGMVSVFALGGAVDAMGRTERAELIKAVVLPAGTGADTNEPITNEGKPCSI
ncbi:MAG: alcohol dehydrogenase catalytic domain-containing protein [Arthrobacter sp.]|uniref:zinc-dependent alcohol dehydrogenase n=1 Tax=Arthrobacter sp. TaxID=1667 RepID=UPI003476D055